MSFRLGARLFFERRGAPQLPYDAEVEYLESTGTQYIDTGFKANTTTTRLDIELMLTQNTANMGLFGSRNASGTSGTTSCNAFFISGSQSFRMDWASGGGPFFNCSKNTAYSISITRGRVTINGSTTTYTNTDSVDQANNFLIFTFAEGAGVVYQNGMVGRVFGAKIYSNNVLVRDMIPVRVGAVGYMYDRVSKKLFGNAGTGDFVLGPDVVPVEWLGFTGTQWIDTGYCLDLGAEIVETKFQFPDTTKPGIVACDMYAPTTGNINSFDIYNYVPNDKGSLLTHYKDEENLHTLTKTTTSDIYVVSATDGKITANGSSTVYTPGLSGRCAVSLLIGKGRTSSTSTNLWLPLRGNVYYLKILNKTTSLPIRNLIPVRVGTEGAMMDTLTRKIYRNAGTGAFSYGNDLNYPIPAE